MDKTRVFIVGGTGYVGSSLAKHLRPKFEVLVSTRHPGQTSYFLDLSRTKTFEQLSALNVAACIVCAAFTKPDECFQRPAQTRYINVDQTIELFKTCIHQGIWIYYFSSDHVLAGDRHFACEKSQLSPISEYGRQKAAVENWLSYHCESYTIIRTSKIFSGDIHSGNQLTQLISSFRRGNLLSLAYDQLLTPIFVEDIAEIVSMMIHRPIKGLFHLATPGEYTRLELGRLICDGLNLNHNLIRPIEFSQLKLMEPRPVIGSLSSKKLQSLYGHSPRPVENFLPLLRSSHLNLE